jgi:hypothetical protein
MERTFLWSRRLRDSRLRAGRCVGVDVGAERLVESGDRLELLGTFETVAQIAITLTGFTGVVVAFGRGELREWSPEETFFLQALLSWSLGTMFLALVPSGLSALSALHEPWRAAHGLFALFHGGVFLWWYRAAQRIGLPTTAGSIAAIAVGAVILAGEILVALGLLGGVAATLYLVALLWFLLLGAIMFIALVFPRRLTQPPND